MLRVKIMKNYEQGIVLNGQASGWRKNNSGFPQGSVLVSFTSDLHK